MAELHYRRDCWIAKTSCRSWNHWVRSWTTCRPPWSPTQLQMSGSKSVVWWTVCCSASTSSSSQLASSPSPSFGQTPVRRHDLDHFPQKGFTFFFLFVFFLLLPNKLCCLQLSLLPLSFFLFVVTLPYTLIHPPPGVHFSTSMTVWLKLP